MRITNRAKFNQVEEIDTSEQPNAYFIDFTLASPLSLFLL